MYDKNYNSFKRSAYYPRLFLLIGKIKYTFLVTYRFIRVQKIFYSLMGSQYVRSKDMIEIDITYECNLLCYNCNRSSAQAPEKLHMSLEKIKDFVKDSLSKNKQWKRIRVLGGEPTLHPKFLEILEELLAYKHWNPGCIIEVVTNGYGTKVNAMIQQIPKDIWIENSNKSDRVQPDFGPFNLAPVDEKKFKLTEFANGCSIMKDCGMGLTPMGYYPCAIAGGIDRILGKNIGLTTLPDDSNDMEELVRTFCQYCGRFRDGYYIPKNLRSFLMKQQTSVTWDYLYKKWNSREKL
jgi:hypothetical protein